MSTETQRLQADESSAPALRNVARIYTQGRYRRASVLDGPGDALVRRDDAMNLAGYWRQVAFLRWQALQDMTAQRDAAQSSQAAEIEALRKNAVKHFTKEQNLIDERDELRRALEIIAVGDAKNPQKQAADELIALGWWRDIAEARSAMQTKEAS